MRFQAKSAAFLLAGFGILAAANPLSAALSCNPMKSIGAPVVNNGLSGVWKMSVESFIPLVCTFKMTNIGIILPSSDCIGANSNGNANISGAIQVTPLCKVTGSFKLVYPSLNFNDTYTIDASIHQSSNKSASIIMGDAFTATHHNYFWMIQASN